ncbi:MAG: NAD(+)/NADH kinase [Candidatus Bathyarchaeia archaeon]
MDMKLNRIAVVSRPDSPRALEIALQILRYLKDNGVEAIPEESLALKVGLEDGKELRKISCDAMITVGGDGTVLRSCMNMPDPETPILAVNMGRRGYLTEIGPSQALDAVQKLLRGEYHIESHSKISVFLDGNYVADGLNEALIVSSSPSKMLEIQLSLGGRELMNIRGDGLIISTPTGSTAHAFSAGGPVLHTRLNAFNIVFLGPLDPIRSLVTPDQHPLQVNLLKGLGAILAVDGCIENRVDVKSTITVRRSEKSARFIRFKEDFTIRSLRRLSKGGIEEES